MASSADNPFLAPSSLEGSTLQGVYKVEEKIAHGGMAWVYRARHARFGSPWALKILFPHHAENPEVRDRFMRESYIQHQLTHPNVVRVHDLIEERGVCGYVMEWCGEGDLRQLLYHHRGPMPLGQAAFAFDRIVSGVWYAHKRGIVHRDLKPENILLSSQGDQIVPRITDFGIAKVLEEMGHTDTGAAIGTFSYMSPEQFLDAKNIDERSDIYALGVILYLMTTGRIPFHFQKGSKSNFLGMMLKVQHEPPPPADELPLPLQAVLMRCLEKEPEGRYPDCGALSEAFAAACRDAGISFAPLVVPTSSNQLQTRGHDALSVTPSPVSGGIPRGELSSEHTPLPTPDIARSVHTDGPATHDELIASAAVPREFVSEAPPSESSSLVVYWKVYALMAVAGLGVILGLYWLFSGPDPAPTQSLPGVPGAKRLTNARELPPLRALPSLPREAVPLAPPQRRSVQQMAQQQKAFLQLKALLEQKQWRPSLTLYRRLAQERLDADGAVRLLASMTTTFPLNVQARLARLLEHKDLRGDARKRCMALQAQLMGKTAAARRSIRQLQAQVKRELQQAGDFKTTSQTLLAMVKRYPTAASLRMLQQQVSDSLARSMGTWPQALAWVRQLQEQAKADQTSGLFGWLRLWSPRLYTKVQLDAQETRLALQVRVWRGAQSLQRTHARGDFRTYARHLRDWQQHQRLLAAPTWSPYRTAIQGLVATPLAHQPHLQTAVLLHQTAARLVRQSQFAAGHKALLRLEVHIQSLQAVSEVWRRRWRLQIKRQLQRMGRQLRQRASNAMQRKQWRQARRLFDAYLRIFPAAPNRAALRKQRDRAHSCASSPPGLLSYCR